MSEFKLSEYDLQSMQKYLKRQTDNIPTRITKMDIDEYATRRIMPPGSPRPGPWENEYTPYLVESMKFMSPSSPIQRDIVLKGAQGGWSALAEMIVCFYMDEAPSDILFMSAGDDLLERWATRRLEPAIDSFGIRHKLVVAHGGSNISKKSGDKTFSKDYYGGRLDMASARSPSKQRAVDKRILIRDEIDGVPAKLSTGEGYWLEVSWARTKAWGPRRKVFDFGTPTTYADSETWKAYLLGDQRKWLVPCPHCGKFQEFVFGTNESQHGIKPVYEAGTLTDAVYVCEHCREAISDTSKRVIMQKGEWKPTTRSSERFWTSRHWSGLYNPFVSFMEIYSEHARAKETPEGMRSFTNLVEGLPYKEQGTRISASRLVALRSTEYTSGHVPEGVLFVTFAADVQKGSANDPNNPHRIEVEVLGHGKGRRTWSLAYLVFKGPVDNAFKGAWQDLYEALKNGDFTFKDRYGIPYPPKQGAIDSGAMTHVVYIFVSRVRNVYAVKGEGNDFTPDKTLDKRKKNSDFRYKVSKTVDSTKLFIVATNEYKRMMYSALRVKALSDSANEDTKMLCRFPADYTQKYFNMLNAEEQLVDGSFDSGGRRNEAVDCRVYNLCMAEDYLNNAVEVVREAYRKKGYSEMECRSINSMHILEKLYLTIQDLRGRVK